MIRGEKAQALTEMVLLFPIFMLFVFIFAKIFALLILVQKLEIASFYAARRWQLESHRNAIYAGPSGSYDFPVLLPDINNKVLDYLGYNSKKYSSFLNLTRSCRASATCPANTPGVTVQVTQVWNVVTVTACTAPPFDSSTPLFKNFNATGFVLCSTKYVPNRDRPIAFVLPGLSP